MGRVLTNPGPSLPTCAVFMTVHLALDSWSSEPDWSGGHLQAKSTLGL